MPSSSFANTRIVTTATSAKRTWLNRLQLIGSIQITTTSAVGLSITLP
jgi:hypothetical protein